MATTAYVIWERSTRTFAGNSGQPQVFSSSADAQHHVDGLLARANESNPPKPVFDIVTVQV